MGKDARTIEALLKENRSFPPPPAFAAAANTRDNDLYREGESAEEFWGREAARLHWFRRWDRVLEWDYPLAWWFNGGTLNASYNCLDRHVETWRRNKAAIIWEGEPGDAVVLTYRDLYREVNKFAAVLRSLGVKRDDRVAIYLPMIPELPIAMLACARIGAVHNVVFGGFSASALRDRINDIGAKILITADGGFRKGRIVGLKESADTALDGAPSIERVIVAKRTGERVNMHPGRDLWWHELMAAAPLYTPPEHMEAEDPLFILHTSGTSGKPKGVVHTTGGYLVGTATTSHYIFDLKDEDVYWCTADIGWITGHSYVVYGPLANGATVLMYEGSLDYPQPDRSWQIIEKYGVTIFYTAPTAIRSFMRSGPSYPARHDLSSLRLLGSVGEPINPEAWMWYYNYIGHRRCPIVDTWWQTETGMILISPLPGLTPLKPGSACRPFPGIEAAIVDERGEPVPRGKGGYLVIKKPWPAMMRTIFGDPDRYVNQYWNRIPGYYFTGDGARQDEDGYFWLLGRVDDVINVSGHRLGTMEVESALVDHPDVAEAAVISREHEIKGQTIVAFVTLKDNIQATPELARKIKEHVVEKIGALARPDDIFFTAELPKTRSGKIMRRLLRDVAEGRALGDISTLADPATVAKLKKAYADEA
ncbi:acetate--CoA ligase [Neomoorella thermoacetica]|uniref:Acetyl-coenzyme A synthetase n=1 Tax=Neomoorella thermoacetica TaxID=1525 RepID=A0A1J5JR18_NEOTH|nr:acetate--CoA ligase [Moorella thermoacetica]OIQ09139.1 acetyl-coenzyme A synthetase [Moorella thermoacetica]OIQ53181.1 acetyl-coenzyme A synthetase [Moorella thermoacetica]